MAHKVDFEDSSDMGPLMEPMCSRCMDGGPLFPANCTEHPERRSGAIGMYHCPDCGAMVLAGVEHGPLCQACIDRRHPYFDEARE